MDNVTKFLAVFGVLLIGVILALPHRKPPPEESKSTSAAEDDLVLRRAAPLHVAPDSDDAGASPWGASDEPSAEPAGPTRAPAIRAERDDRHGAVDGDPPPEMASTYEPTSTYGEDDLNYDEPTYPGEEPDYGESNHGESPYDESGYEEPTYDDLDYDASPYEEPTYDMPEYPADETPTETDLSTSPVEEEKKDQPTGKKNGKTRDEKQKGKEKPKPRKDENDNRSGEDLESNRDWPGQPPRKKPAKKPRGKQPKKPTPRQADQDKKEKSERQEKTGEEPDRYQPRKEDSFQQTDDRYAKRWDDTADDRPAEEDRAGNKPAPPKEVKTPSLRHRIVDGDTLVDLARRYLGRGERYMEIFEANRELLRSPDQLPIGMEIIIPPPQPRRAGPAPNADWRRAPTGPAGARRPAETDLVPVPPGAF